MIAGTVLGVKGAVNTKHPMIFLDFQCSKGSEFSYEISPDMNAGVFIYRGKGLFGTEEKLAEAGEFIEFDSLNGKATEINVKVEDEGGVRFILLAGVPLNEPIARYGTRIVCNFGFNYNLGPFVMSTQEEIKQAFDDYRAGKLAVHHATVESRTDHKTDYDPSKDNVV